MVGDQAVTPSILIGIPSFRRPQGLRRLLASLASQENADQFDIAIFVAESDSEKQQALAVCTDGIPDLRWPLSCRVVAQAGVSAARNEILDEARIRGAGYVAMLDDDEVADPSWLTELMSVQQRTGADVVGGPLLFEFAAEPPPAVRHCGLFGARFSDTARAPALCATNNVLLSCERLAKSGWPMFDLRFGFSGGEDTEYFMRLRSAGFSFAWAPSALARDAVSEQRQRSAEILKRAFRFGNSEVRVLYARSALPALGASLTKGIAVLVGSPILALMMVSPSKRLWAPAKIARAIGKFSALFGYNNSYYGPS
jgi:GT2 family glycosyltransferase